MEGRGTYTRANAAVAGQEFYLLEWLALKIKRDGAAVAASSIELGGRVQVRYFVPVGWGVRWREGGAVVRFDFEFGFVKVVEGADLSGFFSCQKWWFESGCG